MLSPQKKKTTPQAYGNYLPPLTDWSTVVAYGTAQVIKPSWMNTISKNPDTNTQYTSQKNPDNTLSFILVAQVDNYVYAGEHDELIAFEQFLQKRFEVGTLDRHHFSVLGCEIHETHTGSITLHQRAQIA